MPVFTNVAPSFLVKSPPPIVPPFYRPVVSGDPAIDAMRAAAFCSYVNRPVVPPFYASIVPSGQASAPNPATPTTQPPLIHPTTEGLVPVLIVFGIMGLFVYLHKSQFEQDIRERKATGQPRANPGGEFTVKDFNDALRRGPYTSLGSYPVYFVTFDGAALSFKTAKEEARLIRSAIRSRDNTGGWRVIGVDVNWEDPELYDDHSGARIESAYAEPE